MPQGRGNVAGGKRLKETQAYPDAFGEEVGRLMAQFGPNDLINTESEGTDDTDLSSDSKASSNFEEFPDDFMAGTIEELGAERLPQMC